MSHERTLNPATPPETPQIDNEARASSAPEPSPPSVSRKKARSRRLYYLDNILRSQEYFALEEIQHREPAFYQLEFLDAFTRAKQLASEARARKREANAESIVDQLLSRIDRAEYARAGDMARSMARETEEEFEEEEEDEDDEEEEGKRDRRGGHENGPEAEEDDEEDEEASLAPEDDPEAVSEFIRATEQRWLAGQDPNFDYATVDLNEDNDDPRIRDQDAEDAYFGEEDDEDESEGDREGTNTVLAKRKAGELELGEDEYDY